MSPRIADHVLEVARRAAGLLIAVDDRADLGCVIAASDAAGHRYLVRAEDRYRAAVALAELVGVVLDE